MPCLLWGGREKWGHRGEVSRCSQKRQDSVCESRARAAIPRQSALHLAPSPGRGLKGQGARRAQRGPVAEGDHLRVLLGEAVGRGARGGEEQEKKQPQPTRGPRRRAPGAGAGPGAGGPRHAGPSGAAGPSRHRHVSIQDAVPRGEGAVAATGWGGADSGLQSAGDKPACAPPPPAPRGASGAAPAAAPLRDARYDVPTALAPSALSAERRTCAQIAAAANLPAPPSSLSASHSLSCRSSPARPRRGHALACARASSSPHGPETALLALATQRSPGALSVLRPGRSPAPTPYTPRGSSPPSAQKKASLPRTLGRRV